MGKVGLDEQVDLVADNAEFVAVEIQKRVQLEVNQHGNDHPESVLIILYFIR